MKMLFDFWSSGGADRLTVLAEENRVGVTNLNSSLFSGLRISEG